MTTTNARDIARAALDKRFTEVSSMRPALVRPAGGWVRAIRTALGMTAAQLGQRMGIAQASVTKLEKAESQDRIQLGTLRRAAEALDCELHYVLLPRGGLQSRVEQRRTMVATRGHERVAHTMGLEKQYEAEPALQELHARHSRLYIRDRDLWEAD